MKMTSRGAFAAMAVCAAAAVAAVAPAAGAHAQDQASAPGAGRSSGSLDVASQSVRQRVPLMVPLNTMETALPVDSPAVEGSVPAVPVAPPGPANYQNGQMLPHPLLPSLATNGDGPAATVAAPVPGVSPDGRKNVAQVGTPEVPLHASGPEADVVAPAGDPIPDMFGMSGFPMPNVSLTSPRMDGQPQAQVGVAPTQQQSRLPVAGILGDAGGMLMMP
ncbi:hypothetical protein [Wenjunlia tyrosinilytica]|uniref:Uncharacterized protein n=1 Tax=Wenjunlia tyrosinilytica TaxID=1544741 RepID=A0A918E0Y9_9ACTN|nr:hypothetical protein [Wenjunlia tyrosinilytica]GGO96087.1 hypothetical protein GCM10012280_54780 [Wenjunlia tyrosinilytica]